jgi:hypothetical protein
MPPLLIGLLIVSMALAGVPLNRLVIGGATTPRPSSMGVWHAIPAALGLLLVGGALWGLLKGLPRWNYTWVYAIIVLVTFVLVVMGEDRPALVSPVVDAFIAVGILCALAAVALLAAQRSQSDALNAGIGCSAAFVLVSFSAVTAAPFNRLDLALLALPAGLVFSALLAIASRAQASARWTALGLTIILSIGLMWVYTQALPSSWADRAARFAVAVLRFALAGLVIPPLLAWVWQRRRPALAH